MYKKTLLILLLIVLSMPLICSAQITKKHETKVSFDFMDADVRNVFRILAEISGKNIIISDDVKGKVTMKLDNIPWNEALELVIKTNKLAKIEDGNIIRVLPVDKFIQESDTERQERQKIIKERADKLRSGEELVTETIFLNYATAGEVEKMIQGSTTQLAEGAGKAAVGDRSVTKGFLSEFGTITQVKWNNALIIKDTKENVEKIKRVIREHDIPPMQVQIEARIVVAESSYAKELGVRWNAQFKNKVTGPVMSSDDGTGRQIVRDVSVGGAVNEAVGAAAGTLSFVLGTAADAFWLDAELSAREKDGLLKTVSHPKVVTSNNQKAKIAQGEEIPYQYVAQTGATPTTEFKKVELSLEVTPTVTRDGHVKLNIKATKNEVKQYGTLYGATTKEATTEVIVQDGDTAVLGGVYETKEEDTDEGVPFFRHIPVLGYLFRYKGKTDNKTELLIFVTPTVEKKLYKVEG